MECVTDPNALCIPPAVTGDQVPGFATSAATAVLGGDDGQMADLARADLRRHPAPLSRGRAPGDVRRRCSAARRTS